jgi:hypothetical protein
MLDPWIIEQIRRREEEKRKRRNERPSLELPVERPSHPGDREKEEGDGDGKPERGVAIINFTI